MLAVDRETFLPDDLLFKIDIATMSHNLEARSPLLDHLLVEFVARLPGHLKVRGWQKKYIFKKALRDIVPSRVLKRKKRGFDVPVDRWLRGELREVFQDMFSSNSPITEICSKDKLEGMFKSHLAEREDWGRFLWMILMLNLWLDLYFGNGSHI
jgi:asparagine synthase (glutamine-hydrolysing)